MGVAASLGGYFVFALSDTTAFSARPDFFWWWLLAFSVGAYQLRFTANNVDVDTSESVAQ